MNIQKPLTEEQLDVLKRLKAIFKEAEEKHIGFVFDYNDGSTTAFNAENILYGYPSEEKWDDCDKVMDWDICYIVGDVPFDSFNNSFENYYVKFKKEE